MYNLTYGIASDMRLDLENAVGETIYEIDNGFRLAEAPYYKLYIDGYWISAGGKLCVIYSRTSVAGILVAHLPRLFRTRS